MKFTPAEDRLLAIGLEKFGTRGFNDIQKHILPTKSITQLFNRYKNMSSSRAINNPLKVRFFKFLLFILFYYFTYLLISF